MSELMPAMLHRLSKKNSALNDQMVNDQIVNDFMADGYLESHYAEYEKKKAEWLKKKKQVVI